jgi:hypothetical protein
MSDVQFPNFTLQSSTNSFSAIWKLTRALKKAGWTYLSSSDGYSKDTSGISTNDKWGGNADPATDLYPGGQALITTVTPATNFTQPAIGSNVTVSTNFGNLLSIGQIVYNAFGGFYRVVSISGSSSPYNVIFTLLTNWTSTGTLIAPGGTVSGNLFSPNSFEQGSAWWNAQGPTTLKIPFTTASTGTFLRGEKITQLTSLAEGELVGYEYDGVSVGHLVVLPRTGTFDNTHTIVGASSGAILTPNGTLDTFVSEIVIWKSNYNSGSSLHIQKGSIYIQRVSIVNENASRFSVLATSAACTAYIAPGGGNGVANNLPTVGTWSMLGSNFSGTTNAITHGWWYLNASNMGKVQIVAMNNIPGSGISQDGTFWVLFGNTTTTITSEFLGYFRMDNSEDGDIDPFVTYYTTTDAIDVNIRYNAVTVAALTPAVFFTGLGFTGFRGGKKRGFYSGESFVPFCALTYRYGSGGVNVLSDNIGVPENVACSYTAKRLREPLFLTSSDNTNKIRKGSIRWLFILQGGTTYDTWDTKTSICILPYVNGTSPSVIAGKFDGITSPLQN